MRNKSDNPPSETSQASPASPEPASPTPLISLREALERASFEELKLCFHTGRIPVSHWGLYASSTGAVRSAFGDLPPALWPNARKDRAGRIFFCLEWVEDGRVEEVYAYDVDIRLDLARYETCFPVATGPAESDGMWVDGVTFAASEASGLEAWLEGLRKEAAQENALKPNVEAASSAPTASPPTEPQTEPQTEPGIAGPAPATSTAPPVNLGGRPTDRDMVLGEADWRLRHQLAPKTLAALGRELREWLSDHGMHRAVKTGEVMKAKTIEGHIRPLWKAHKRA
jgi:hypothetical protein